jgi:hypothetical protein
MYLYNKMTTTREVIQINPTNLGDGVFSDRNGLNQIIFEIPQMPKIMNGKSLRVSGKFTLKQGGGQAPQNGTQFFVDNGAGGALPTGDIMIDGRTGLSSVIETLSIQNLEGATYSTIKQYNRLCSSLVPMNESIASYLNGGVDTLYGGLGKDVSTAKKVDKTFDFALPILDGFIQGQPIDLQLVKGLRLVITLAPSNFVIHNNKWRNSVSNSGLDNGGAFYELSDVLCYFEAESPDAEGQEAMMMNRNGVLEYNTYSSFYNVLQSNDHNITLNINTGRTIATIGNIIPSSWLNNYQYNSSQTLQLLTENAAGIFENRVQMDEITFTKGGLRIPLDFELVSRETQNEGVADSFKNWESINAIRPSWSVANMLKSLRTDLSNPLSDTIQARFSRQRPSYVEEDNRQQYNIGVNYDHITDNGMDFRGNPLGIRIQSTLPSGVSIKPHSIFLYILHKNTIVFQDGMVNIIS